MRYPYLLFVALALVFSGCANNNTPLQAKISKFSKLQIGMSMQEAGSLAGPSSAVRMRIKPGLQVDPKAMLSEDAGTVEYLYENEGILVASIDRGANQVLIKTIVDTTAGKFWPIQQVSPK